MTFKRGDEIVLKVEDDFGYKDKTYRSVKVQVVGYNVNSDLLECELLVYVPPHSHMKESWTLSPYHARHYGVDPKFVDETVAFITQDHPIYKHFPCVPGEKCDRCGEFFEGVENVDGRYRCGSCTLNPWR